MTKQEFMELYGEVEVKFDYYYKYTFSYVGTIDGHSIQVEVGGDENEIYRHEVSANAYYKINELYPCVGRIDKLNVYFDERD